MRWLIAVSILGVFVLESCPARAEECFDIMLVAAKTDVSTAQATCSVTYGGWGIGLPTPWGTVGYVHSPTIVTTQCAATITYTPEYHKAVPNGRYRVTSTIVHGWVRQQTGCHAEGNAAVCDYSETATDLNDYSAGALCGGYPPKT